ncbi:MAG: glycosyltransferase family 1 protein [Bacilli bacterium]|nr:glycosyltransferase family 1 protein [Bacilli bacterium]MDD4406960.1 glycosyltransferase family 1 protein [Bacilli bacterium]
MKDKISKFINVTRRDGLLKTIKKSITYINANYINKININKRIKFNKEKDNLSKYIDDILSSKNYNRILVWRGSFGWNVPLFQRPQQIANILSDKKCLIFYEVTRMTDKVDFIKKEKNNLYLVDYEINNFEKFLFQKLKETNIPKYLQLYSTCWDVKKEKVDLYVNNGFGMLYEYIDDLNPILAGTDKLPKNVEDIHNYVINNKDVLVVTSADQLYKDMVSKRKNKKNIILSSNGADIKHFTNLSKDKIIIMENIKKEYKTIIGYYGALASWFDYDLIKRLAKEYPDNAFVLIGIKYDTSFDVSEIEKLSNIKYLGSVNYKTLPNYAKYFDIAWIPFIINKITLSTNPIKVFEYMALEKFIITSDLPECKKYKSVNIAKDYKDYKNLIENYKILYTSSYKKQLIKDANDNSWEHKAEEIKELLAVNE